MNLKSLNPNKVYADITELLYNYVVTRDNGICQICGGKGEHLHHIKFKGGGGKNMANNLILLCQKCHTGTYGIHGISKNMCNLLLKQLKVNEKRMRDKFI
jgi:5-methylcytosine-specific restriction endonuclease McrA